MELIWSARSLTLSVESAWWKNDTESIGFALPLVKSTWHQQESIVERS